MLIIFFFFLFKIYENATVYSPPGGLLSVIVQAHCDGMLHDAMIVPIAINYDRLLDGNFTREQLSQTKVL